MGRHIHRSRTFSDLRFEKIIAASGVVSSNRTRPLTNSITSVLILSYCASIKLTWRRSYISKRMRYFSLGGYGLPNIHLAFNKRLITYVSPVSLDFMTSSLHNKSGSYSPTNPEPTNSEPNPEVSVATQVWFMRKSKW